MMWASQNFLLHNRNIIKMKVTEWRHNLKKMLRQSPPPLGIHRTCTNYNNLIPVKYNHTCTKEINLMPSTRFSNFKFFFVKNEKIDNYGLNYHRYKVQPLVFRIFRCSF